MLMFDESSSFFSAFVEPPRVMKGGDEPRGNGALLAYAANTCMPMKISVEA